MRASWVSLQRSAASPRGHSAWYVQEDATTPPTMIEAGNEATPVPWHRGQLVGQRFMTPMILMMSLPSPGKSAGAANHGASRPIVDIMGVMKADVFYRTWNRDRAKSRVRVVSVEVPADATLDDVIRAARAPRGTRTWSGVFEVQTDDGVWSRPDEGPLWKGGAVFRSWDQVEEDEVTSAATVAGDA